MKGWSYTYVYMYMLSWIIRPIVRAGLCSMECDDDDDVVVAFQLYPYIPTQTHTISRLYKTHS